MKKYFMGVSALHHDSAAALIDSDGNIINISQEERRTNIKNDKSWPQESIDWCIRDAQVQGHNIKKSDITFGYYEKPWLKLSRRIYASPGKSWMYFQEARIPGQKIPGAKKILHHQAHALAATATAPFDRGMYLTIDALGEWNSTTWGTFDHRKDSLYEIDNINYPHSLGLLYAAFTRWLGLTPNEEEFIVMGAAAFGKPIYAERILNEFIEFKSDGTFRLKKDVFRGVEQYLGFFIPVEDWHDWAASIQAVCETVVEKMIEHLYIINPFYDFNLVLSGGVALNCVSNSKILKRFPISNIWILPSPGDSGNALGAAAHAAGLMKLNWKDPYLGADIDQTTELSPALLRDVTARLELGEVVGWIQGREEFGPRALGHRSLLADARNPEIKDNVNAIKSRQKFRPFAAAVLEEKAFSYFEMPGEPEHHHYMQFTSRVRDPKSLPGICHIDNSTRVQTVPDNDDSFRALLEHWEQATGCAVLLNTSLNIKGQPLISDRANAVRMLLETPMNSLVIGNRLYFKVHKAGLDEGIQTIVSYIDYDKA